MLAPLEVALDAVGIGPYGDRTYNQYRAKTMKGVDVPGVPADGFVGALERVAKAGALMRALAEVLGVEESDLCLLHDGKELAPDRTLAESGVHEPGVAARRSGFRIELCFCVDTAALARLRASALAQAALAIASFSVVNYPEWRLPDQYSLCGSCPLGRGISGDVWEAVNAGNPGWRLAVKQLSGVFNHLIDAKRMYREVSLLRRLKGEHVVQLLDVCLARGDSPGDFNEVFLVFEKCDRDLKSLIAARQPLSEAETRRHIRGILLGLDCLHRAGVLHRDLKPANCLLAGGEIRLADLGLSRRAPPGADRGMNVDDGRQGMDVDDGQPGPGTPSLSGPPAMLPLQRTVTSHVVTRWYRAPEVILRRDSNYGSAIDVWAAGCVAGELFQLVSDDGVVQALFQAASASAHTPAVPAPAVFSLDPAVSSAASDQADILEVIVRVLGAPPAEGLLADHAFCAEARVAVEAAVAKVAQDGPAPAGGLLDQVLTVGVGDEGLSQSAIDLVRWMLTFAPSRRPTVREALAHAFFAPCGLPPGPLGGLQRSVSVDYETPDEELIKAQDIPELRGQLVDELRQLILGEIQVFGR